MADGSFRLRCGFFRFAVLIASYVLIENFAKVIDLVWPITLPEKYPVVNRRHIEAELCVIFPNRAQMIQMFLGQHGLSRSCENCRLFQCGSRPYIGVQRSI